MVINKLCIIDGSYFLHRSLKTPDIYDLTFNGVRTGGIFQFLRILTFNLDNLGAYPIVMFDGGLSKRRLEIHPDYKRSVQKQEERIRYEKGEMTQSEIEEYESSVEYLNTYRFSRLTITNILKKLGIPTIMVYGTEGDDLIAVATKLAKNSIILTDDKDMIQLVSSKVTVKRPMTGQLWDEKELQSKGYRNGEHYMLTKAIVGDGSDNIPQLCKGVGEKKAVVLADNIMNNTLSQFLADNGKYKYVKDLLGTDYISNLQRNISMVNLLGQIDNEESISNVMMSELRTSYDSIIDVDGVMSILMSYGIKEVDVPELVRMVQMSKYNISI
jgi:5'-3' exonuclease